MVIRFVFGPAAMRRNDLFTLRRSRIATKLYAAQILIFGAVVAAHFVMYGDAAYPPGDQLRCRHNPAAGHPQFVQLSAEDSAMNSCRTSVEHHYGHGDNMFPVLNYSRKVRILAGQPLKEIYWCKALLRNCYVSLYGNLTTQIFNCEAMRLAEYLS